MAYHSALKPELPIISELDFYSDNNNLVFRWDITQGMHETFTHADAIYSEPSWKQGYSKFLHRAGIVQNNQFTDYLTAIRNVILTLQKPAYIIAGKHMLKKLAPAQIGRIKLHGYDSYVALWFIDAIPNTCTVPALLDYVCTQHSTILDFCCGYGNVASKAKHFVCSDVNAKCVYYVAKNFMGYEG